MNSIFLAFTFVALLPCTTYAFSDQHNNINDYHSIYVGLHFTSTCHITTHGVVSSEAPPSQDFTPFRDMGSVLESEPLETVCVTYRFQGSSWKHCLTDPRSYVSHAPMEGEPHYDKLKDMKPERFRNDFGSYVTHIPLGVKHLRVYCHNVSVFQDVPLFVDDKASQHHVFRSLTTAGVETGTIQLRGPVKKQHNLVFLSGGYTLDQKELFISDVKKTWDLISNPPNVQNAFIQETSPFTRYSAFMNVYYVFEPSAESGASVKNERRNVNNNLGCFYPEGANDRGLRCEPTLVIPLAQVSAAKPGNNIDRSSMIVLVNHNKYGGTGIYSSSYRLGVFSNYFWQQTTNLEYNKISMASLVTHEMGHAITMLMDEYNIGTAETNTAQNRYPNCYMYNDNRVPWKHWLDSANAAAVTQATSSFPASIKYNVLSEPTLICGFTNWYRPVATCMMSKLNEYFMCPVCREAATTKFLTNSFPSYGEFRCPTPNQISVITTGQKITLELNSKLTSAFDFDVKWTIPNGGNLEDCKSGVCKRFSAFTPGKYQVVVFITHDTKWIVKPGAKNLNTAGAFYQNTTFVIVVTSGPVDISALKPYNINVTNATMSKGYCGGNLTIGTTTLPADPFSYICNSSDGTPCDLTTLSAPKNDQSGTVGYVKPPAEQLSMEEVGDYLYISVVVVCVFCVLLWIWSIKYYKGKNKHIARPIFTTEFSGPVAIIRTIMAGTAVMLMVAAVCVVIAGLVALSEFGPFGRIILFCGLVMAFMLYILAFVGFWAVENRSMTILLLNEVLLLLSLIFVCVSLGIVLEMGTTISQEHSYYGDKLDEFWESLVADHSDFACQTEIYLKCTGFLYSCDDVKASSATCPANCEANSKPYSPCKKVLQDFVIDNYATIVYACVAVIIATFFAVVFNFVLWFEVRQHKMSIKKNMEDRLKSLPPAAHANPNLRALCLLKTLNTGDSSKLLKEFRRIDEDDNGKLDKTEFFRFFHQALCYRPTPEEIDVIFNIADSSGDGVVGVNEFLSIFAAPVKEAKPVKKAPPPIANGGNGDIYDPLLGDTKAPLDQQEIIRQRTAKALSGGGGNNSGNAGKSTDYSDQELQKML